MPVAFLEAATQPPANQRRGSASRSDTDLSIIPPRRSCVEPALQEYKHPPIPSLDGLSFRSTFVLLSSTSCSPLQHQSHGELSPGYVHLRVSVYCGTFADDLQYKCTARSSAPLRKDPPPLRYSARGTLITLLIEHLYFHLDLRL